MDITYSEIREKEVINIADGKRLGHVCDLKLSLCGRILGIMVPGDRKLFRNMNNCDMLYIEWNCIIKVGDDALLVELVSAC